jgi:hypothetical protein
LTDAHIVEWSVEHSRQKLLDELANLFALVARDKHAEALIICEAKSKVSIEKVRENSHRALPLALKSFSFSWRVGDSTSFI